MKLGPTKLADLTDSELIELSIERTSLFGEIFERHYDAICAFLTRRIGSSGAEDLASQTFVIALEGRSKFIDIGSGARPWLYGIATNLLLSCRRQEVRRLRSLAMQYSSGLALNASVANVPEEQTSAKIEYEILTQALKELDDDLRDTLLLFAWADLSYEEISIAQGIAVGTVGSRIARGRRFLANRLDISYGLRERPQLIATTLRIP